MPLDTFFRGPYYNRLEHERNRRRSFLARPSKPRIRKLQGMQTWVCSSTPFGKMVMGFGLTPALAYNAWKRALTQC